MKHYLLYYDVGPDYAERRAAHRNAHLEKAWAAHDQGHLVLGGALADPLDGAVLLFKGDSPALAEAFAKADPYVVQGLVKRWHVREWTTVVGREAGTPIRPDPGTAPSAARRETGDVGNYVIQKRGDMLVIEVHGPQWGELTQFGLKDEVRAALALGHRGFVIDFSHTGFITSLGLGILVAAWAGIRQSGGTLKVCGVGPRVRAAFEVAGLDRVLEMSDSREDALRSLETQGS